MQVSGSIPAVVCIWLAPTMNKRCWRSLLNSIREEKIWKFLTANETAKRSPGANPDGLLCSLWSSQELCVNPPAAIQQISSWLSQHSNIAFVPNSTIVNVDEGRLNSSTGNVYQAERIAVCSGSDFETLFPEQFASAGLLKCKLQMLATEPQPDEWRIRASPGRWFDVATFTNHLKSALR